MISKELLVQQNLATPHHHQQNLYRKLKIDIKQNMTKIAGYFKNFAITKSTG
jgi:hypothetical protein